MSCCSYCYEAWCLTTREDGTLCLTTVCREEDLDPKERKCSEAEQTEK